MTKETKIGLLVGLAFIVLFAIILSEKGARRGVEAPGDRLADATRPVIGGNATRALDGDGRVDVEGRMPPIVQPNPELNEPVPAGSGDNDERGMVFPPLPPGLVDFLNQPLDMADAAADPEDARGPLSTDTILASGETPSRLADEERLDAIDTSRSVISDVTPARPTQRPGLTPPRPSVDRDPADRRERRTTIRTVHVVEPGECLGKIAARFYGRATPSRIQAIFDANRDVLTDQHAVRANDRLQIPNLPADGPPRLETAAVVDAMNRARNAPGRTTGGLRIPPPISDVSAAPSPRRPSAIASVPVDGAFRWYQTRSGDSLSRIAKKELGNSALFDRLFRMNRDRIEDKHKLKTGIRIRLPLAAASAASPVASAFDG